MQGEAGRVGSVSPGEEKAQGDLIKAYKYPIGEYEEGGARHFSVVPSDRTSGSGTN